MTLPEEDVDYLSQKGYKWQLQSEGSEWWLTIEAFPIGERYSSRSVDMLIRIPPQYNQAPLDMWFVSPEIKLGSTGAHPPAASHFEDHFGRRWQRFSRHFPTPWRPGIDGLSTLITFAHQELQENA